MSQLSGGHTSRDDERGALSAACVVCATPLGGVLGSAFRVVGITRSSRNPNLCSRCNTHAEEGKLVELTVLFADLSSFTQMTHDLGAERTHEVVNTFLQMATSALVQHGAFIDKYVGDAVMALFNVPIRSAAHAAEAVAAAEEILGGLPALGERFGRALGASIGVASGWAHVGRLGSQDGRDYTAIGDAVNLAARLQAQARPGEILVDRAVYRAVAERHPAVPAEPLALKGFPEATPAYRLHAASAPPPAVSGANPRRRLSTGALIFAVLGAPCAAATLIGPLAVTLGLGSAVGASGVLWALGDAPIRYPVLVLAALGAVANLYTLWHARRLRQQTGEGSITLPMTRLERRQTAMLLATSLVTFAVVGFELYAHDQLIGQMPPKAMP